MWLNRKFYALLARIIALLGFATYLPSCIGGMYAPEPAPYGCNLTLTVLDESGNGIEGIRVNVKKLGGIELTYEPVYTDASGQVVALFCGAWHPSAEVTTGVSVAEDVDGAQNGGEFQTVEYGFSMQDAKPDHANDVYFKSVEIVMKKK